jgi:hypothetical protein
MKKITYSTILMNVLFTSALIASPALILFDNESLGSDEKSCSTKKVAERYREGVEPVLPQEDPGLSEDPLN